MKVRLQMREQKTPEQERLWLLSTVNQQLHAGGALWKPALLVVAVLLLVALLAIYLLD